MTRNPRGQLTGATMAFGDGDYRSVEDANPWQNPKSYAPDCYDALAIVEHYERVARQARREKFVKAFCIAVAVFCIVYFGGIELVGLVK